MQWILSTATRCDFNISAGGTYKSLILHRVTDAPSKQPKWPKVLETKVKDEVSHQDEHPNTEELDVGKCAKTPQINDNCTVYNSRKHNNHPPDDTDILNKFGIKTIHTKSSQNVFNAKLNLIRDDRLGFFMD